MPSGWKFHAREAQKVPRAPEVHLTRRLMAEPAEDKKSDGLSAHAQWHGHLLQAGVAAAPRRFCRIAPQEAALRAFAKPATGR